MPVRALAQLVMISQSLFSLPWGLAAIILAWPFASQGLLDSAIKALLAIAAVLLARTAGMSLNRLIDRDIDRLNPRTSNRPLQVGLVQLNQVIVLSLACMALLVLIAASLGPVFLMLSPLVLGLLVMYSYTKRFTWLCHFVLGSIHACAPILTYLAIADRIDASALYLGLSAGTAIAAADILYALQDIHHDQKVGLYSIPARFGCDAAQKISLVLYAISAISLAVVGMHTGLGIGFWLAWVLFAVLPIIFHIYLKEGRIYEGFFRCSLAMSFFALTAVILGQWRFM